MEGCTNNPIGDVVTKPTSSMLQAIAENTLLDDVFMEDTTTNSLQEYVAKITNHEAGLLVMSGTMGNGLALRTHLMQPPHSVLCDSRADIINFESGGVPAFTGAHLCGVVPQNGVHLTLEDIKKHAVISDDVHSCPTKVVCLENTLGGMIMPLDETRRISEWTHANDIKLHLDGARLWEAVVSGAGSLPEFASLFDSVSLCFSKGLGAPIGSIIVGPNEFIKKARWFRKMIGGGTRQSGIIAAPARVAVEETFGTGPNGEGGKLAATHARAKKVAEMWISKGGKLAREVQTNMVWLDLDAAGLPDDAMEGIAKSNGLNILGNRVVIHYQISDEAIERLGNVMDTVLSSSFVPQGNSGGPRGHTLA
ncbi:hypothetical protein FQN54_009244 [Arachnomyces sp. PD_36]|nr:hypothetical protein FQN54_009244 [Arachnomyces sp. PD_36]